MDMKVVRKLLGISVFAILASCGGEDGGGFTEGASSSGSGADAGADVITVATALATLSAGGSTSVTATLNDAVGNPVLADTEITFTSSCVTQALASLSSSTASTVNGVATITYTATGCLGTDTISATDGTVTSTADITVLAGDLGSIQFSSVSASLIALQGTGVTTGVPETSNVVFTVKDTNGNVMSGKTVLFSLSNSLGGVSLASTTGTSNSSGQVTATVQSGSAATSVRVTATVTSTSVTTQSGSIAVSTGFPDQDSMSLSMATLNPRAWDIDGTTVAVTARVADRYNNPVQNGTTVLFRTELGSIGPSCTTVSGACSVNWVSQAPRGTSGLGTNVGRGTILATVAGEESFLDLDGDGYFSAGDTFTDLPEAFEDDDEDGVHDAAEPFVDQNINGTYSAADALFNGLLCSDTPNCSSVNTTDVRDSMVFVMSEDSPTITVLAQDCALPGGATIKVVGATNGQLMPAGTTVTFTATNGTIAGGAAHTIPNVSYNQINGNVPGISTFQVDVAADGTASSGVLFYTIVVGGGGYTITGTICSPLTD